MEAPAAGMPATAQWDAVRWLRLGLGLVLALLATVPVYRLLDRPETGLAGLATVGMTDGYVGFIWAGLAMLLIPALIGSRTVDAAAARGFIRRIAGLLAVPSTLAFAVSASLLAFAISATFGAWLLQGQPNLIDAMSQLLHARFIADGAMSGPGPELGAFWQPQLSLFTANGWVSQYPPAHALLLAVGLKLGVVWAVGPAMLALTVFFASLAAEQLLPRRLAVARAGTLLIAVSPFMIAHAGSFMNHTTAAAFGALAVWCGLRCRPGKPLWAVVAGAGIGAMFATRPLSGLTLAAVLCLWLLAPGEAAAPRVRRRAALVFALAAGAAPFIAAIAAYNIHFFGAPTTFGYGAALGPAGGTGFGIDPWGNAYGPLEAFAYTSAELTALSLFLLETPLPVVAVVALWLMTARRLDDGERLIAAWALAPLATQLLYWHHGLFMGPRMLNETAPAWCLLVAVAASALIARLPGRTARLAGYSPQVFAMTGAGVALLAGLLVFGPMRLSSYMQRPMALAAAAAAPKPALVFVHGGWTSRLSAQLSASGMRLDSVETALRQNPTCEVQAYVDARLAGGPLPVLDLEPRAWPLPASVEVSPGNRIRLQPGERLTGECARQAAADRLGTIDVSPLLWRGDVPGRAGGGTLFVRDLGPEANRRMIAAAGDRRPFVLLVPQPDAAPRLVPYADGMGALWSERGDS